MAKINIVKDDSSAHCVTVDGVALNFDLAGLVPDYVWAIQFDTQTATGELQYNDGRLPALLEDNTLVAPASERHAQLAAEQLHKATTDNFTLNSARNTREFAKDEIDRAASRARARFISFGVAVEAEYRLTLDQAQAFRSRSYINPVPATVQAHADAFGVSPTAAADEIIATAAAWFSVIEIIRSQRLIGKARIVQAPATSNFAAVAQPYIAALDALTP